MSNIRVTYSGLIAFVVGISSVVSGLFFTLLITRQLTPQEYGTWALLGTIIGYLLISERIISYWNYRQIARGEKVGKTSLVSSMIFTTGIIPVFFIFIYLVSSQSDAILDSLILGVILLPVHYISQTLTGINFGFKPQAVSYSLFIFENSKIPAALAFVFFLDLGINGAIIAILTAYLIKIVFQSYFGRSKIREKFQISTLKRWIKLSWVSLYWDSTKFVRTLDIFLYIIITNSVIGVAYFYASFAIANIVAHAALITQGLGPKLLATGNPDQIRENFTLMMYFSLPLLGIAIIFSKPALFALNPLYQDASVAAMILSLKIFLITLSGVLKKILVSLETVDMEQNPKFSKLIKSNLFLLPSIRYIFAIVYIVSFVIILFVFKDSVKSEFELITLWALIGFVIELPLFIVMWILVHKKTKLQFPYIHTLKYLGATLAFVLVFHLTSDFIINYEISIYDYLPSVLYQLAICVVVYLGITYLIDAKTRNIFKLISNEIVSKK